MMCVSWGFIKSAESGCQSLSALFLLLNGRNERNRSRQPTSWLTCKNGAETFNPRRFQGSEKTALNKCYFMRSFQAVLLIFFSCILPVSFLRGRLHFGIALEVSPAGNILNLVALVLRNSPMRCFGRIMHPQTTIGQPIFSANQNCGITSS